MASIAATDVLYIQRLLQTTLGGIAVSIVDRSPGYSGSRVYAVDVATAAEVRPCIVKLTPDWGEEHTWPVADQLTNWVYGSNPADFGAAYGLLRQHGIPLPRVVAALAPRPDLPMFAVLMQRLAGDDVERLRAGLSGRRLDHLDAAAGAQLGAIHRITRDAAGWVEQPAEAGRPWRDTFFAALHTVLERACAHAALVQRRRLLEQSIAHYASRWSEPATFVLSHGDGLQALLLADGDRWSVQGVIDIEDFHFTDPRFVLGVYELRLEPVALGDAFWRAYQQRCRVDSSYQQLRPLFQLYALLDWLSGVPAHDAATIDELLTQVDVRVSLR